MRKAWTFIKKVIGKFHISLTIKLPLINVTLTPSRIQQPIWLLFLWGFRGRIPLKREPTIGSNRTMFSTLSLLAKV